MKCLFRRKLDQDVTARSSQIVPVASKSMNRSILETYARSSLSEYGRIRRVNEWSERNRTVEVRLVTVSVAVKKNDSQNSLPRHSLTGLRKATPFGFK
jgi:hypothetical protein